MNKDEALKLALEALEQVDPYVDQLVDYSSTAAEYPLNNASRNVARAITAIREALAEPDYRAMYLKVRDELAALQQNRSTDDELNCVCGAVWKGDELVHTPRTKTPLTSKEIRAIEVDVATNLSLDYPSPAEQFTRAIEARHGIK